LTGLSSLGAHPKNRLFANTVLTASIMLALTLLSVLILCFVRNDNIIFFNFKEESDPHIIHDFQTQFVSLYFLISVIFLIIVSFTILYFVNYKNGDSELITDISKSFGVEYTISLFLLSISFVLGILLTNHRFQSLLTNTLIHCVVIACLFLTYKNIKNRKNLTFPSYLSFYVLLSIILSLSFYVILYGCCNLILYDSGENKTSIVSIVANVLYCVTSTVLITYYKDVFFSLTYLVILIGYMTTGLASAEFYSSLTLLIFISISILLTIIKYRNQAFGYANKEEISDILLHHEYQKSIKRQSQDII